VNIVSLSLTAHQRLFTFRAVLLLSYLIALGGAGVARAQPGPPPDLRGVGFDQRLDAQVPLGLVFRDEAERTVHLGDYFGAKPVILVLAYYKCPNLCTLVLTQLVESLRKISFDIGDQFEVVTVSIDPRETPVVAAAKKATYLARYGRTSAEAGWHFLTGDQPSIAALAQVIGFHYTYDAQLDQYMHPTGIMVLTPAGRIARYFYGIDYAPDDLRLGLVEASAGKIGSPVDQILLFCYHYDPATGKYDLLIRNILWVAVGVTVLALGAFVLGMRRRERRLLLKIADRE
jgi:protein SCO1/2